MVLGALLVVVVLALAVSARSEKRGERYERPQYVPSGTWRAKIVARASSGE